MQYDREVRQQFANFFQTIEVEVRVTFEFVSTVTSTDSDG